MRIGIIIRRLRLTTRVPLMNPGHPAIDNIKVDRPGDTICASACFLVYAAGATRFGDYLVLHRPHLARRDAQALSDTEYVAAQKQVTSKVKAYLADMDVDQHWIDRMFGANSQEQYTPTWDEVHNQGHNLMGVVPSLEEVVLSKCKEDPSVDAKLQVFRSTRSGPWTSADDAAVKQIFRETEVFDECERTVLSDMQDAAFARENESAVAAKCGPAPAQSEVTTLRALLAKGQAVTPDEAAKRSALLDNIDKTVTCRSQTLYEIQFTTSKHWEEARQNAAPKPPPVVVAEDFDAKGLSAAEMVKRGKNAYQAERWGVAEKWFRKAADLGDVGGMTGMSWIYFNGKGVPRDDAQGMRWVRMAADHGNTDAMLSLGIDYAHGWSGLPQDYTEAMRWSRKAADLGSGKGMMDVAELYQEGHGVPQDYAIAMHWFRKAADAGADSALVQIGHIRAWPWRPARRGTSAAMDQEGCDIRGRNRQERREPMAG